MSDQFFDNPQSAQFRAASLGMQHYLTQSLEYANLISFFRETMQTSLSPVLQNVQSHLAPTIAESFGSFSNVITSAAVVDLSNLLSTFENSWTEKLEEIYQKEYTVRLKAVANEAIKYHYLITPNLPGTLQDSLVRALRSKDHSIAFPKSLSSFYKKNKYQQVHSIFDSWCNESYFSNRKELLNQCLSAHKKGYHYLTISALVPLSEGFIREKLQKQIGVLIDAILKLNKENSEFDDTTKLHLTHLEGSLYKGGYYPEDIGDTKFWAAKQSNSLLPPSQYLNRHAIMHGFDHDFSAPENFYRLILTIDGIFYYYKEGLFNDDIAH